MTDHLTSRTASPERILVIETLYLGDLIHTLPLIQAVRMRYPQARLDLLVRAAHRSLMQYLPGIGQVLVMDPQQHRGVSGLLSLCGQLRKACYDLVLNPGASDRATLLTAWSGGKHRLGRLNRNQSKRLWPLLHDAVIAHPWGAEPMYWQKLTAFQPSLQLADTVRFGLDLSAVDLARFSLPTGYIHISPFASEDLRSLPPATLLELVIALRHQLPGAPVVVSCGPSTREQQRLAVVRPTLEALGVVCHAGTLSLPELAAVIGRAALHIGPDSGPLHLAMAQGTPSVACFLFKDASAEWMPVGVQHRTVGVTQKSIGGLYGLPVAQIAALASELMAPALPAK